MSSERSRTRTTTPLIQIPGQKPPHRIERAVLIEILMATIEEAHDMLRLIGELKQVLAHRIRHGLIVHAMQDQKRRRHFADAPVGVELIIHQKAYRQIPIVPRADGY